MELPNLLAFFQIAVAFDFGLLFISGTHIFSTIHTSLLQEMNDKCESVVLEAEGICEKTLNTTEECVIRERVNMVELLDKLYSHLTPRYAIWNKYSYLGLFSGIYGLLCLFVIGIFGCKYQNELSAFLLISGEITILFQIRSLIQLRKSSDKPLSTLGVGSRLFALIIFYIFSLAMAWSGIYFKFFSDFETPFLTLSILIVYMPILVYVGRIFIYWLKYVRITYACETQYMILRRAIGAI